jgi:hypothetical protein
MNIKRDIKINSKDMNAFYRAIGAVVKQIHHPVCRSDK